MRLLLKDVHGNEIALEAQLLSFQDGELRADLTESLYAVAERMVGPTSPATTAPAVTYGKYVEPDPRTVKCPLCPHMASNHSDSGCIQTNVADRQFRQPGVMGYCKCVRTYQQVMLAHKAAALAEGFTE
jgi:hypothetical protein